MTFIHVSRWHYIANAVIIIVVIVMFVIGNCVIVNLWTY